METEVGQNVDEAILLQLIFVDSDGLDQVKWCTSLNMEINYLESQEKGGNFLANR
jgi:hypothetical protein